MSEEVEVTQEDREAAAALIEVYWRGSENRQMEQLAEAMRPNPF